MKKWTFRLSLVMLVLMTAVAPFAEGQRESAAASQGPVSIDFWTTDTQSDRMATIQVLIDTFEALNPGTTINLIGVDENDLPTQINTAANAGTMPAIIQGGAENMVAFGSEGLLDVDAATSLINDIGKDEYYQGTLKLVETGETGRYYAVPTHGWVQGIWYRADWFEEAGLEPPDSWDNILKAARYFNKPEQNQYGILVGTKAEVYAEQCFTQIAMANGARLFDKDGNLVFNSPEMKEAIEYYAELAKYTPPGPQTWRARDYYLQGKMAMFFYSTYIMDDLALAEVAAGSLTSENFSDLAGADFDPELVEHTRLASTITESRPAGYGVVVTLAMPKQQDAAKTAAAKKFLRYLFTPNAYITWLHMAPGGMNPVLKDIASNERFLNDPKGIYKNYGSDKMVEIIEGLDSIDTFSIVEGNRIDAASTIFVKQILPQMIYMITQEGRSVDEGMAWAEAEMRKLM